MTFAELTLATSILAPVVAAQKTADGDLPGWLERTNDPGQRINLGERRDQEGGGQR